MNDFDIGHEFTTERVLELQKCKSMKSIAEYVFGLTHESLIYKKRKWTYKNQQGDWVDDDLEFCILYIITYDLNQLLKSIEEKMANDLIVTHIMYDKQKIYDELNRLKYTRNLVCDIHKVNKIIKRVKQMHNRVHLKEKRMRQEN